MLHGKQPHPQVITKDYIRALLLHLSAMYYDDGAFIVQCWVLVRIAVLYTQLVVSCNTHCLGDRSVSRAPEAGVIGASGRQRRQRVEVARANPLIGQMWKPGARCKRALLIRV